VNLNKELIKNKKNIIKGAAVLCILIAGGFSIKPVKTIINNKSALAEDKYTILKKEKCLDSIEVKGKVESLNDEIGIYADAGNQQFKILKVNCKVGDKVKEGDVLALLDSSDLEKEIAQKKEALKLSKTNSAVNLKIKQEAYESLKYKYDNELISSINECSKNLKIAENDFYEKIRAYDQNQVLNETGAVSDEELKKVKEALENAENIYENSVLALETAKKDTETALSKAKNEYESAKAANEDKSGDIAVELEEKRLSNCEIKAVKDGTITEVNVTEGTICGTTKLFEIKNLDDLIVEANVKENDIAKVAVNQHAEIRTDSLGEDILEGVVYDVYPSAKKEDGDPFSLKNEDDEEAEFTVKIKLKNKDKRVRNGMNSIIDIVLEEKNDAYIVPSNCIIKEKNNNYIYAAVKKDTGYVVDKILVTKGTESDTRVEISGKGITDNLIVLNTPLDYDIGNKVKIKE